MNKLQYIYEVNIANANDHFYDSQIAFDHQNFYEAFKDFKHWIETYENDEGKSDNFLSEREYLEGCVTRIGKNKNETINDVLKKNEIFVQCRIELNVRPSTASGYEDILTWIGEYEYDKNVVKGSLFFSNFEEFLGDHPEYFSSLSDVQKKEIKAELKKMKLETISDNIEEKEDKVKDGYFKKYYDNGNLKESGYLKNGFKDGLSEVYYENGQIREKGDHKHGIVEGFWEYFNKDGTLNRTIIWNRGNAVEIKYFK